MKKYLPYIITLDIIWAFAALIYDVPAIAEVPIYFWPFIVICPVFPALLALTWYQIYRYNNPKTRRPNFSLENSKSPTPNKLKLELRCIKPDRLDLQKNKPNDYLLAFAALPSAIYFLGALIFYPTKMVLSGFNLLDFGQIFWVAVYGVQGIYLLYKYKIKKLPLTLAVIFLSISLFIQYSTKTYHYLDFSHIFDQLLAILFMALLFLKYSLFVVMTLRK